MTDPWPSLEKATKDLESLNYHEQWNYKTLASHLNSIASAIERTPKNEFRSLFFEFHNTAGRIPYINDCDIGALILESVGDTAKNTELKLYIYEEAAYRAKWCAESGASGGECIARSRHLNRINEKCVNIA